MTEFRTNAWILVVLGCATGCSQSFSFVIGADSGTDSAVSLDSGRDAAPDATDSGSCAPGSLLRTGCVCGGLGGGTCGTSEFCDYALDAICGAADQQGICQTRPDACTEEYAPVCGCDGMTHSNTCSAHAAGTSVARIGPCTASCDARAVRCRAPTPVCPSGQVPSVVGSCWGPCVPIDACTCMTAAECPESTRYTCHTLQGRCGPFIR